MKANNGKLAVSALALAVNGALAAMAATPLMAWAEGDPDVAALTAPTNYVEIGVRNTSDKSAKFGEYNGLNKKGASFVGNFSINGGNTTGSETGTTRWSVTGSDLGTTSRELGAAVSNQGTWSLGIGYDQLRHNIADTYQTPYQGSMGGNAFTLPASFGVVNTSQGTATTTAGALGLTANQQAAFHTTDVYSERQNTSLNGSYSFNKQFALKFDYKRIDQSGAKLIGSSTDPFAQIGTSVANWGAERVAILMNPTKYKTDNFTLTLSWMGDNAYLSGGYYGSLFHDDNSGVTWSNPFVGNQAANSARGLAAWTAPPNGTNLGAFPLSTMSTPPSNQFHQLNLTGGYTFGPATKLTGGISYARNTQNDSYSGTYTPGTVTVLPVASLDGSVVSTHANMKLTHRASSQLNLSAGLKYNERDNRTASNAYDFYAPNGASNAPLGNPAFVATNIPMSNRRSQFEIGADYKITGNQRLHVGYDYDHVKRWCNSAAANNAQGVTSAYYTTASCVQVPENKEDTFTLGYKLNAGNAVSVNASYQYKDRTAVINPSFYNPLQAIGEGYEVPGYVAFFDASRTEDQLKLGITWQATPKLSFGLTGKAAKDDYGTTLGVQKGDMSNVNLDVSYSYSDQNTVSAFATGQKRTRDMKSGWERSATVAPTQIWANHLSENDLTVGLSGKQSGLMGDKIDLRESLTYSVSKTDYDSGQIGGAAIANCSSGTGALCGAMPTIKSEITQLKLSAAYNLDKAAKIVMGYLYQRLKANDYFYAIYQAGSTSSGILPTNQQSGSYKQNVVFAAYNYSFK